MLDFYKDFANKGSKPGVLYGLVNIHKIFEDITPYFQLVLSATGTPTYNLAKFCDMQ